MKAFLATLALLLILATLTASLSERLLDTYSLLSSYVSGYQERRREWGIRERQLFEQAASSASCEIERSEPDCLNLHAFFSDPESLKYRGISIEVLKQWMTSLFVHVHPDARNEPSRARRIVEELHLTAVQALHAAPAENVGGFRGVLSHREDLFALPLHDGGDRQMWHEALLGIQGSHPPLIEWLDCDPLGEPCHLSELPRSLLYCFVGEKHHRLLAKTPRERIAELMPALLTPAEWTTLQALVRTESAPQGSKEARP